MRVDRIVLAGVLCLMLGRASNARAVDITDCGATVPKGEVGELLTDIVCDPGETGVVLEKRAVLHLNGHSISGGDFGAGCADRCVVEGPGEIFGAENCMWFGVKRVTVRNLSMHDCPYGGIGSGQVGDIDLENVTLSGISGHAIHAGKVRATNLSISNSGSADAYGAIYANFGFRGTNVQSSGNFGIGLYSNRKVQITGYTATDNWHEGVSANSVHLKNSFLTNNGIFGNQVDILSAGKPKLDNVVCELSRHRAPVGSTEPWGVCITD